MTQKEKAKAYDEAIEKAKHYNGDAYIAPKKVIEEIFPELKESGCEKKLKESLMQYLWDMYHKDFVPLRPSMELCDKWIAWIEKQGEKSLAWNEEYERHKNTIIRAIHGAGNITPIDGELAEKWLKSIKDRVQPQSKQEWSEEDEKNFQMLQKIICDSDTTANLANKLSNWLISLRIQSTWKPSDAQMEVLDNAIAHCSERYCGTAYRLGFLRQELKKLRGE